MTMNALELIAVDRTYHQADRTLPILASANLVVRAGEMVALVAPSGTGKSTLLHCAGLLEKPDAGDVLIGGMPTIALHDRDRTRLRRTDIGFVYQFHHLLPELTATENVMMPQMIAGLSREKARARAAELLQFIGLGERLDHQPGMLSGGEQQRVAIARAVANAPRVLLADEPTGNLDPQTSDHVFGMLLSIVKQSGLGALVATHNVELAMRMDRRVTIRDGAIEDLG